MKVIFYVVCLFLIWNKTHAIQNINNDLQNTKIAININSSPNNSLKNLNTESDNTNLNINSINNAKWSESSDNLNTALNAKIQVLLNRHLSSTGTINGKSSLNTIKAISAFQIMNDLNVDGKINKNVWDLLNHNSIEPVFMEYQITSKDLQYNFIKNIPLDYAEQAKLKNLNYVRMTEMLAERFSMDELFLQQLNPNHKFNTVGETIIVANINRKPINNAHSLIAHKGMKQLFVFNETNKLIAAFPITIGSEDAPSPTGTHKINTIVQNPYYSYSPKNFIQDNNLKPLSLPPGPNNPVGNVWIGLSKPSFGIHGSPSPSLISKSSSHGCVRLTNWDVQYLSKFLKPGMPIKFIE